MVKKVNEKYVVSDVLNAEQVQSRKDRTREANLCYVSLKALTDENRFDVVGMRPDGTAGVLFSVDKIYGEAALKSVSK